MTPRRKRLCGVSPECSTSDPTGGVRTSPFRQVPVPPDQSSVGANCLGSFSVSFSPTELVYER